MNSTHYQQMPENPADCVIASILQRNIDGLGFRLYWACHGLRTEDLAFRPADDCMSTSELLAHIEQLIVMISKLLSCPLPEIQEDPGPDRTLTMIQELSSSLDGKPASDIAAHESFWHLFNGPLADAFTHIGQINSWRRINGNPIAKVHFFKGTPA